MSEGRIPLTIPLKPWFQDHCFGGKSVLPAVETMHLLAAKAIEIHPEVDIRVMENVRFAKFLEIPADAATLPGFVECETAGDGRIRIKLLSRMQCKAMSRIKEHGEIFFPPVIPANPVNTDIHQPANLDPAPPTGSVAEIKAEYLYRRLVPFGPSYQTLQETLFLFKGGAWGKLKAPELPRDPIQEIIGSPFPLDGALHAACVLGQQAVDFVPFPVGFDRRVVIRPTQPGYCYLTKVTQLARTDDELIFDLAIFDNDGQLYETITGLRMRDVGGAMKK